MKKTGFYCLALMFAAMTMSCGKQVKNDAAMCDSVASNLDEGQAQAEASRATDADGLRHEAIQADELFLEEWDCVNVAEGDLNGDGRSDAAFIGTPRTVDTLLVMQGDEVMFNMNEPVVAIYFRGEDNILRLWKRYSGLIIPMDDMGGFGGDIDIDNEGRLKLLQQDADFATDASYTEYGYRYKDGDFYLVTLELAEFDRMVSHELRVVTYDYEACTKTLHRELDQEGPGPKDRIESIAKEPLKRIGEL